MSALTLHAVVKVNDQDLAISVSNEISGISNTPVTITRGVREWYLQWELPPYSTFTQFLYEFQRTEAYELTNWTTIPIKIDVRQTMDKSLDPYEHRIPAEARSR